jgi:NTP pyrophosphatase (non-canonical NTP hydrolase)
VLAFRVGFLGDVGDLPKLVMAEEGARTIAGSREALGHELADCLWSVLILADRYGINLAAEVRRTMSELEQGITSQLADIETA